MLLSVVTVTYRRVPLLLRKAASLREQTLDPARFEWCVVSNGDPEAAEALAALQTPFALRPLVLERNTPVAAARNAAAAAARGELLLLSDDDVLLPPGCLAAHLRAHGVNPDRAHDQVSDTSPEPSVDEHGPSTQRAEAAASPARPRVVVGDLRLPAELEAPSEGGAREPEPFERVASLGRRALWINATGANTSLTRAAFEAVGGFDAAFAGYGGEDSDLALRLKRGGAEFVRSREAWAVHVGLITGDRDKAFAAGRAGVRVWRKHGGWRVAMLLGVHPALLALKRAALATPLQRLWGTQTAAYERAYLRGAVEELRTAAGGLATPDAAEETKGGPGVAPTRAVRGQAKQRAAGAAKRGAADEERR